MKKKFTVVGLYEDNKQVCVEFVEAKDVKEAVRKGRRWMKTNGGGGAVLAVFEGKHMDLYGEDELYEE
jgi:hypothetical protein